MSDNAIDYDQVEAMGISRQAYDEILDIVGRQPTLDELSTLLAMWESNGKQQSLYGWLRGQHHAVQRDEYLYGGSADHKSIREPKVKECIEVAKTLTRHLTMPSGPAHFGSGILLYMVGNVSSEFVDSEYARRCLHLVKSAMGSGGHEEDCAYIEMILMALKSGGLVANDAVVSQGGLFCSLLRFTACGGGGLGFDILVPREVRLDAFLFGEEMGRYLAAVDEAHDDAFLLKMDEARLNCCFLGRSTKGRIVVDGYDFGPVKHYIATV